MKLSLISLAASLCMATVCHAENVVGCSDGSGVTFQAAPCPDGTKTMPTAIALTAESTAAAEQKDVVVAAAPVQKAPRYRQAIFSTGADLEPGMSDMQVLNNRRWGKPQKITRTREARAWHERWSYQTGSNGGKQLHFINGVLASIEDLEVQKPVQLASMISIAAFAAR